MSVGTGGGSWDSMLATIHSDPFMAVDVRVRLAAGGDPIPCRMAWMTGDATIPLLQTGTGSTTRIGEIRVAVLASVDEGDLVDLLDADGGVDETLRVDMAERPEPDRLLWRLWLVPATEEEA